MPIVRSLSPLATLAEHPQDVTDRQEAVPHGLCVHTTGRGLPAKARALGIEPMGLAIDTYCTPGLATTFPHYVIGHDGTLVQIADDRERARHAGVDKAERAAYLDGTWIRKLNPAAVQRWRDKWPGVKSPSHLYPSKSPNEDYLGVELIPLNSQGDNGTLFTPAQYIALAELIDDIQDRYGQTLKSLVGHEDLEPLTRWNSGGGWDPGALRAQPFFRWDLIKT